MRAFDSGDTRLAEINPGFAGFEKEEMKYQVSTRAIASRSLFGAGVAL